MNLPNKLTMLRMALIPLFLVFVFLPLPFHYLWALIVFAAASFTDMLDGQIARKRGLVTDFGKLMDPLADKLLVMSALVSFAGLKWAPSVVIILILVREFLVTSIRQLAAAKGTVLAADKWGKAKTVSQMVWICFLLLSKWMIDAFDFTGLTVVVLDGIHWALMAVVVYLTLYSGINYMRNNWDLFRDA